MGAVIAVTGAAGALGTAICRLLIARGHTVIGIDRGSSAPHAAVDLADIDLTDPEAAERAFALVARSTPLVDGLVNVAGGFEFERIENGSSSTWTRLFAMNTLTALHASRAALPLLRRPGGAIVNVGAAAAGKPGLGMAAYATSKAGVAALTQSLAAELLDAGIRVNAILPSILDTPANRAAMPGASREDWTSVEAAAKVVAYLLGKEAAALTGALLPLVKAK